MFRYYIFETGTSWLLQLQFLYTTSQLSWIFGENQKESNYPPSMLSDTYVGRTNTNTDQFFITCQVQCTSEFQGNLWKQCLQLIMLHGYGLLNPSQIEKEVSHCIYWVSYSSWSLSTYSGSSCQYPDHYQHHHHVLIHDNPRVGFYLSHQANVVASVVIRRDLTPPWVRCSSTIQKKTL